jgi:hypothetical protein
LTIDQALKKLAKPKPKIPTEGNSAETPKVVSPPARTVVTDSGDSDEVGPPDDDDPGLEPAADVPDEDVVDVPFASIPTDSAAEPTPDDAWLESLPIRSRLTDPTIFDVQALLWRRFQPVIDHMIQIHTPSPDELTAAWTRGRYQERIGYLAAALTGVKSPADWVRCSRCGGTGASGALKKECDLCKGAGFEITHRGERVERRADDDGDE